MSSVSYLETSDGCQWKDINDKDSNQLFECKGSADDVPSIYISVSPFFYCFCCLLLFFWLLYVNVDVSSTRWLAFHNRLF